MHLSDFSTDRSEINVYCKKHIPQKRSDGIVWKAGESTDKMYRIFVRSLTDNAKENWDGNHPNECYAWPTQVWGKVKRRTKCSYNMW